MFMELIENYGSELISAIFALIAAAVTALAGYLGNVLKKVYTKIVDDKTKQTVARTVVQGVEQIYKDLNGPEKLEKAIESATEMLDEKGISISELELRMLLEAAVGEFNENFKKAAA